jgi:Ca-activated chloride channel homolog
LVSQTQWINHNAVAPQTTNNGTRLDVEKSMTARHLILLLATCLLNLSLSAQVTCDQNKVNFGTITQTTDRMVDLVITNTSKKPTTLLRTGFTFEYEYLTSTKTIQPDSSLTLRVQYNPRSKGPFREDISVWFTTETKPLIITFTGDVTYIDNPTPCPDFSSRPTDCCPDNGFTIVVVDAVSGEPIPKSRVRLVEQGVLRKTMKTDRSGEVHDEVPISYYLMIADAEGYIPGEIASYINRRENYFEIPLDRGDDFELLAVEYETTKTNTNLDVVEEITIRIDVTSPKEKEVEVIVEPDPIEVQPTPDPVVVTSDILPENLYAKNNVVFLIDVSQSMNQKGKLELLKASMLELASVLRAVDQVAVVTYASNPEVKLASTTGDQLDEIRTIIQGLEAAGMTAGAKGFSKAYEISLANFVEGGNNQIIVCTDGAFRSEDQPKIEKMVKKYARKGITTTVVGIKSSTHVSEQLAYLATEGHGSYIGMEMYDESLRLLVEEIRTRSRRTP